MEIRTFGVGGRISECERILKDLLVKRGDGRLILLPIPTTRDNKYINVTSFTIDDISALLNSNSLVAGYNSPSQILSSAKVAGAKVYDAGLDEEFLTENAELTARGTIGYILTHTDKDIGEMKIGVVGYGRIGIRLIRWLLLFGAEAEYSYENRRPAVTPDVAEQLEVLLVPNSHTHLTMPKDFYQPYEKHAEYMIDAFMDIVNSDVARYITAIPHPFMAVCCPYDNRILIDLISDDSFKRCFSAAAEKGIALHAGDIVDTFLAKGYHYQDKVALLKQAEKGDFYALSQHTFQRNTHRGLNTQAPHSRPS